MTYGFTVILANSHRHSHHNPTVILTIRTPSFPRTRESRRPCHVKRSS
jgi:hypothetical protein